MELMEARREPAELAARRKPGRSVRTSRAETNAAQRRINAVLVSARLVPRAAASGGQLGLRSMSLHV
jgi:hypothetical protein